MTRSSSRHGGPSMLARAAVVAVLVVLVSGVSAGRKDRQEERRTKKDRNSAALVLKNANSNENTLVNGELVSTLTGNVTFLYDDLTVISDNARWWRDQGTIRLNGNVRAERGVKVLTCDEMTFLKQRKQIEGSGRVDYRSPPDGVRLFGRRGTYDLDRKRFVLTGEPHFVRTDTLGRDTLDITGVEMTYDDSLRVASSRRSVVITRGPLRATCDLAHYYARRDLAQLRGKPHIVYEGHVMDGDSVDLYFKGDTLDGVSVAGKAHALYRAIDSSTTPRDTNLTNVWGDSMYLKMNARGQLDSVWAWGNVISTYYLSSASDSANRVEGKAMVLAFEGRGALRSALVWGNARSTYYVREKDSDGRNEASGDTIQVWFERGQASELVLSGKVRGTYHQR